MFCQNCGNQLADGTVFCPFCGAEVQAQQPTAAPQPQYQQPTYQQPTYQQYQAPQYTQHQQSYDYNAQYQQGYYAPQQMVSEQDIKSTRTLGIVSIVLGIFLPLVGFICGIVGLSKARKLCMTANAQQLEELNKSKTLCIIGIVLHAVINIAAVVLNIVANS